MLVHKNKRRVRWILPIALIFLCTAVSATAENVTFNALLIHASNEPSAQDLRLEKVEYRLRRIFGFTFYKHYGEATMTSPLPGRFTLSMGHGNSLSISASGAKKGRVEAKIEWTSGGNTMLNTTVVMTRGTPVILGGGQQDNGTLIVAITAE